MRKILLAAFMAVCLASATAFAEDERLDISLTGFYAFDSTYDENPMPGIADQSYIWGDFDSIYGNLDFKLRIYKKLFFFGGFRYGAILPNTMYLNSLQNSLTIGGSVWGFHADLAYRLKETDLATMDVYVGFLYGNGVKQFYDYTEAGTVVSAGNFGNYAIALFGPEIGVCGRVSGSCGLGLSADLNVSPYYENATVVAGWTPEPMEESAAGWRYKFEAAGTWTLDTFYLGVGMSYEMIYYGYGDFATHDLTIRYAGPFLRVGLKI